jgi:hypothetical protein
LLGVQAVDQTADRRPHRRGEIRHGELDHAANLAAAFPGKRGRQQSRRRCSRHSTAPTASNAIVVVEQSAALLGTELPAAIRVQ